MSALPQSPYVMLEMDTVWKVRTIMFFSFPCYCMITSNMDSQIAFFDDNLQKFLFLYF